MKLPLIFSLSMAYNALPIPQTSGGAHCSVGGLSVDRQRPVVKSQLSLSTTIMSRSDRQSLVVTPFVKAAVSTVVDTAAYSDETAGIYVCPANSGRNRDDSSLAKFWREVHGANDWEYLVQPLHPLLRDEIVRYGEFVTACYKAFDLDPSSKRYLNCKYGKKNVLREVGMGSCGYEVTKYIYATPDITVPIQNGDSCGRWVGYVAVSSDESVKTLGRRDVVVTFRGTVTHPEWVANLMSSLTPARLDPHVNRPNVRVESGFLSLYTSEESTAKFGLGSCREQLLSEVSRLIKKYAGEELSITLAGHSMGSSLAVLLAYDITELGLNSPDPAPRARPIPVTVFSFGGPRVGNAGFKKRCEELGVKILRVVNVNDPITKLPGVLFNENLRVFGGMCYAHVGVEVVLDFFNVQNPSCVHDLETYISLLRCPKKSVDRIHKDGAEFLMSKARELLLSAQNFNMFPFFQNAGLNMVSNLVQSQRF